MPFLKKNNLRHADYATKSVQELLPAETLSKAIVRKFDYTASCVAINKGNGEFDVRELPPMVQLSSLNAIHCLDLNNDGHIDIVSGGNQFDFIPQLERLDASSGDVLINDGKGNFKWIESAETGLNLRGELRDIAELKSRNKTYLLFLQNDEYPVLYELKNSLKDKIIKR
jgi:hypothetical protein